MATKSGRAVAFGLGDAGQCTVPALADGERYVDASAGGGTAPASRLRDARWRSAMETRASAPSPLWRTESTTFGDSRRDARRGGCRDDRRDDRRGDRAFAMALVAARLCDDYDVRGCLCGDCDECDAEEDYARERLPEVDLEDARRALQPFLPGRDADQPRRDADPRPDQPRPGSWRSRTAARNPSW